MSSISSINSSLSTQSISTSRNHHAQRSGQQQVTDPSQGNNDGGLMQSVAQALSQMGINLPSPGGQGDMPPPPSDNSGGASGSGNNVGQALGQLMHDVFDASQQASNSNQSGSSPYSDFANGLQSLISQLDSSTSSSTSSSSSTLNSDFSNLLSAIQAQNGGTTSSSSDSSQTLVTFLKNLQSNLASHTPPSVGGLVGTSS